MKSVKRTVESLLLRVHGFVQSSALRTRKNYLHSPALKRWAILVPSASRTTKQVGSRQYTNPIAHVASLIHPDKVK